VNTALRAEISERKRAEDQMKAALEEKVVLLQEVHHRVKNNLQVVSSLLALQAAQTGDSAVADLLTESRNRVRSIALVHEHLYRSGNFAGIHLAPHIEDLCEYLFHSYEVDRSRLTLHAQIDDVALDLDRAVPCSLIINELVTNALKHAFPA